MTLKSPAKNDTPFAFCKSYANYVSHLTREPLTYRETE